MTIRLPVSGRRFRVPENIRIIGTMNTADQSVAHLDAAIRRRFGFVPVPPDPAVVDSTVGVLALSSFLTELNHRISTRLDRDRQIGHAFYHDIVPLLEDYALGDVDVLARLLGNDLVDSASGQVVPLDPDDLVVTLAKESRRGSTPMPTRYEPPRGRRSLREYESTVVPDDLMTGRDLGVLQALGRTDLLTVRKLPGAWEIRAGAGVLTLDRIVLEIQPKIMVTGEQVMTWLCFALSRTTHVEVSRRWSTTPSGLPDLIVRAGCGVPRAAA